MPTPRKEASVAELKGLMEEAAIVIGAEYRGLSVKEMTALRRALREAGVEAHVVKNRLFQIAAKQAGLETAGQLVEGPTMLIFGKEDPIQPAKAVSDYQKSARNTFAARRAFMDGQLLDAAGISDLASLPSRPELIGKIAGALASPIQNLASMLDDSIRSFAMLAEARAKQLEEAA